MSIFNNNITTLRLTDANGATVTFIYDKSVHNATLEYGLYCIDWNASRDFFKDLVSVNMDVNLFDGDEAFTPDGKTPFYCIENLDEYNWDFLVGKETLDEGLAWVKKTHNATLYAEGKERARQEAIEWQDHCESHNYSYEELEGWANHFAKLGKRYGLTEEFRENGII